VASDICLAQRLQIPHHVADVNPATNKFHAVIHHFVKYTRPVPADHCDAGQIDHHLASPERITGSLPSSVQFRGPGFNDPARDNELSLTFGFDHCDFEHYVSETAMPKNGNANAKDDETSSH
jgi:hypothetical protein